MHDTATALSAIRPAAAADIDQCIAIWVDACATRDGRAFPGVAERARPKFDGNAAWFVAGPTDDVEGFVLATAPGSGEPSDPEDAAIVGLLAVAPGQQTRGLGRALLGAATDELSQRGYRRAVLHALLDNTPAVRLYESEGWVAVGEEYEHSLLKRPMRTFERLL